MGGRRRRRRCRAKIEQPSADTPPKTPSSGSSGSSGLTEERVAPRKIPSSSSKPYEEEEVISAPERKRTDPCTLRLVLLNLIRTFYLEALSRLPPARLWSTHARGVLVAGHCYGPLSPVDNILVNTIWHDTAFPRRPTVDFHFGDVLEISPECIARIAHRSLEGLIACLLHLCPSLSRDDALCHLHLSKADLSRAIASASDSVSAPTQAAFLKAAEEAHHPMPQALALFISSVLPKVERDARMLLCVNRALTAPELDRLSDMLVPSPLLEDLYTPPPLVTSWVASVIKSRIEGCKYSQETSRQLVETALSKYAQQTGQHYELHLVCGINLFIQSEAFWHINFLARPKDAAGELPIYFFAEATVAMGEDDEFLEEDIVLCCPIKPAGIGGCGACTAQYKKLNHPIDKEHHGGLDDYDEEIGNGEDHWDYKFPQLVDFIMFDAEKDCATVRHIEKRFPPRPDGDESAENLWITEM
ncbi:hypothetical protein CFC21_057940 [Triticum aestivum]|uniref:Uncharacterized protein n=2 Tax=Triticum aestivum TaxID=4565 RepID=A0A3B6IQC5_WHEAT|nr:uncharacterized protein LOC123092471 [Triticum aestivum]KAF7049395.1 hypothetical protein CFC21_057940 [Triticum aestivum]